MTSNTQSPAADAGRLDRGVMQHTPGLWRTYVLVDHDGPPSCDEVQVMGIRRGVWQRISECDFAEDGKHAPTRSEALANATVMAAAPLLALAVGDLLNVLSEQEDIWNSDTFERARQALRAAGLAA
jgi:hypothetical protein